MYKAAGPLGASRFIMNRHMKYAQNYFLDKLQKNFSLSSLAWTVFITAIVLFLAASANAQTEDTSVSNTEVPAQIPPAERTEPANLPSEPATTTVEVDAETDITSSTNVRRADVLSEIQNRRTAIENKRVELAERTETRVAALKEEAQSRIINQSSRLTGVLELAISRLQTTSTRLRVHATNLSGRGIDTTTAITMLDEVDQIIGTATEALEGIEVNVSYAARSETPREDWQEAREQFVSVTRILGEARGLLGQVISELRRAITNTGETAEEVQ